MEWVEVRGETLEAAKEEALDQLGVALEDAEFEVVQEPESRWLGFKKTEARVRARVRPTQPRPKKDGRTNRRSSRKGRGRGGQGGETNRKSDSNQRSGNGGGRAKQDRGSRPKQDRGGRGSNERQERAPKNDKSSADSGARAARGNERAKKEAKVTDENRNETMPLDEQQETVVEFLEGLADAFGVSATVTTAMEDDIVIGSVDGDDLGLLIGPRGGTMYAIQELARSAMQRQSDGRDTNRLMVDVAGYRERRRAALAEFAHAQAEKVKAEHIEVALEPMSSADRKAIHDAILDVEGVKSISQGDDPRRRVVLLPDSD